MAIVSAQALCLAYAAGPTGYVWYNGSCIRVTDGQFAFNGAAGTITSGGDFSVPGMGTGNITQLSGVTSYQMDGQAAVAIGSGLTGKVWYNNKTQSVDVTNGGFVFNGQCGTINAQGNYTINGVTKNILETDGVSGYEVNGVYTPVVVRPVGIKPTITANAVNEADGAGQNLMVKFTFTASNVSKLTYNCGNGGSGDISKFNTHWPGSDHSQWLKIAASGPGSYLDSSAITDWNGTFYASPQMSTLAATMSLGTYTCTLTGISPDGSTASSNPFSFTVVKTNAPVSIVQLTEGLGQVSPNGVSGITQYDVNGKAQTAFQSRDFKIPSDNDILNSVKYILSNPNLTTSQQKAQEGRNYILNNHLTLDKVAQASGYTLDQIKGFLGAFAKPSIAIARSSDFGGSSGRKLWGMTVIANDAIRLDWKCSYVSDADGKTYDAFLSTGAGYTTNSLILPPAEASPVWDTSLMIPQASIYMSGKYTCNYTATGPDGQITTQSDSFVVPRNTSSTGPAPSQTSNQGAVNTTCSNYYWFDNTSKACSQKSFCGTYMYAGLQTFSTQSACTSAANASTGAITNEDTTVVDQSCADLTYYMSISLTRSPTATAYTRSQSTDAITEGQVTELQSFLKDQGFMDQSTVTTGRYGSLTTRAVKGLQAKYPRDIPNITGAVGPATRAKIKSLSCDATISQATKSLPIAMSIPASKVLGVSTSCANIPYNMHRGAEGDNVKNLQTFLNLKGFYVSDITAFYGDDTVSAVKDYQASKNLPVTGMVYDATRSAMILDGCK